MNLNPAPRFAGCATILSYSANAQDAITFGYTGDVEIYVVPNCVSVEIIERCSRWRPQWREWFDCDGIIDVVEGEILEIRVGGAGECPAAGYNGGGVEEPLVEATLVAAVEAHGHSHWRIQFGESPLLLQAAEAWAEEIRMLTRVREGAMPAARG